MGGGERVWAHLFCEQAVPTPNERGVGFRKGACLFLNAGGVVEWAVICFARAGF